MVKCECNGSWQYVLHYCYCVVHSMINFLVINCGNCNVVTVCSVSLVVCGVLCAVFCSSVVCYFCNLYHVMVICVVCLIVVPLPPGKTLFAVKIIIICTRLHSVTPQKTVIFITIDVRTERLIIVVEILL
jgi:hypothetical protein